MMFVMRQALTAFLLLILGLGPLASALPASDDARLPACCRRDGAHHCEMAAQTAAAMSPDSTPGFRAPSTCPNYPGPAAALLSTGYALASAPAALPVLTASLHASLAGPAAPLAQPGRSHAGRGPPAPASV